MLSFDEVDFEIIDIETDSVICQSSECRTEVYTPCDRD